MEKIGIIGVGRLGVCLALNLERVGYSVIAVDTCPDRVNQINTKNLVVPEASVDEYLKLSKNLVAHTDVSALQKEQVDFIFICVPTPSLPDGKYDHSYINSCVDELLKLDQPENEIDLVINSTTMPGFCDELQERVKDHNLVVSYNPEFIAQGQIIRDQQYPDQVLIGEANQIAGDRIQQVYKKLCFNDPAIHRMSRTSAEITKLGVNCFLTTKIAFANAVGDLAIALGGDHEDILSSIGSDSRVGGAYLGYGYGFGGPCLPRDNRALSKAGEKIGMELLIGEATDQANINHLQFQFDQIQKTNSDKTIIFDQVTYKKGTDILEESQQLALAVKLMEDGRTICIKSPSLVVEQVKAIYGNKFQYEITDDA